MIKIPDFVLSHLIVNNHIGKTRTLIIGENYPGANYAKTYFYRSIPGCPGGPAVGNPRAFFTNLCNGLLVPHLNLAGGALTEFERLNKFLESGFLLIDAQQDLVPAICPAVLTPIEADALFRTLRAMTAEGRTVIFISHKLDEVMAVSDRITVLRGGRTVGTVDTSTTNKRDLASMMVGRNVEFTRVQRKTPAQANDVVLNVENLGGHDDRGRDALHGITLTVGRGEIVGVAGVAGNGQRELAEVIAGMRHATTGSVSVEGKVLQSGKARAAIAGGIAHVPEDRLHTGLAAGHSVEDNLALKSYRSSLLSRFGLLRRQAMRDGAEALVERYDVKTPSTQTAVRLLSGGNVQKVLLAREFSTGPKILIAASPTRGLDVGAIESVRERLVEAADGGLGVLLISEDLDEIMSLADRIAVMYEGRIVAVIPAESADRETIGLLMGGSQLEATS